MRRYDYVTFITRKGRKHNCIFRVTFFRVFLNYLTPNFMKIRSAGLSYNMRTDLQTDVAKLIGLFLQHVLTKAPKSSDDMFKY